MPPHPDLTFVDKELWKDKQFIFDLCKLPGICTRNRVLEYIDKELWKDRDFLILIFIAFEKKLDWLVEYIPNLELLKTDIKFLDEVYFKKIQLEIEGKSGKKIHKKLTTTRNPSQYFQDVIFVIPERDIPEIVAEDTNELIKTIIQKVLNLRGVQKSQFFNKKPPLELLKLEDPALTIQPKITQQDLLNIFNTQNVKNFLIEENIATKSEIDKICELLKKNIEAEKKVEAQKNYISENKPNQKN